MDVDVSPMLVLREPRYDRAVTATIVDASADVAVCRLADGTSARLPVTAYYPNRIWTVGSTLLLAAAGSDPARVSATADELPELLLHGLSPEVRDGRVRVMGVARHVGVRSKVAVAATVDGLDPVGACLGRAATRIRTLSTLLCGERVDVVSYHPDPATFLANALAVAPTAVVFDDTGTATVTVPRHQEAAARGGGNLNVVLAARLCGLRVKVQGA